MEAFFGAPPLDDPFRLFGGAHFAILTVLLVGGLVLYLLRGRIRRWRHEAHARRLFGLSLIAAQAAYGLNNAANGMASLQRDLPLSLCGASMVLTGVLLMGRSERLFRILYFWGVAGVVQALITPNLGPYGPSHFRFYQFAYGHIGVILGLLYMVFVHRMRPRYRDIYRSLGVLLGFTGVVLVVNVAIGANYLYLLRPPAGRSALDMFPAFPLNVPVLLVLSWALFHLCWLPFARAGKARPQAVVEKEQTG